jgi:hypothetical protein
MAITGLTFAVFGGAIAPAAAAWNSPGYGPGTARGGQLGSPVAAAVTTTSAGAHLAWTAPSAGVSPGGYIVTRDGLTVCPPSTSTSCDDTNLAPGKTYTYLVSSTAGRYWVSATPLTMTATTTAGSFTLSALSPSVVTAGVGLTFTVSATYGNNTTDTAYVGAHPLTITSSVPASPGGNASGGQLSATFVAGIATKVATTVYGSGTQTLIVSDGARTGSLGITVSPATSTLELVGATGTAVVCPPNGHLSIAAGQLQTARVAVADAYGNLVTVGSAVNIALSYTGSGTLSRSSLTVPNGTSVSSQSFNLTMPTGTLKTGTLTISAPGMSTRCTVN